jgi:hypothetical protein
MTTPHPDCPNCDVRSPRDAHNIVADDRGFPILTVGALRKMLEGVSDLTQVVVATPDWYDNVQEVIVPGDDPETAEFSAVTFFLGDEIDPRQF